MAYTIKTWEKEEFVVTEDQGKKLIEMIESGVEILKIKGSLYKASAIAQVKKGGTLTNSAALRLTEPPKDRREQNAEGFAKFQELKRKAKLK